MMQCLQFHGIDELANVGGSAGRGLFDPWCGLGLLADSWEHRPPFPNDAAFASNIREYRQDLIEKYRTPAGEPRQLDMCVWLRRNRDALDHTGGVGTIEGPEILQIVAGLEGDKACVEDLRGEPVAGAKRGSRRGIPPPMADELRGNRCARPVAGSIGEIGSRRLSAILA
jgi:hypothetical protein